MVSRKADMTGSVATAAFISFSVTSTTVSEDFLIIPVTAVWDVNSCYPSPSSFLASLWSTGARGSASASTLSFPST